MSFSDKKPCKICSYWSGPVPSKCYRKTKKQKFHSDENIKLCLSFHAGGPTNNKLILIYWFLYLSMYTSDIIFSFRPKLRSSLETQSRQSFVRWGSRITAKRRRLGEKWQPARRSLRLKPGRKWSQSMKSQNCQNSRRSRFDTTEMWPILPDYPQLLAR